MCFPWKPNSFRLQQCIAYLIGATNILILLSQLYQIVGILVISGSTKMYYQIKCAIWQLKINRGQAAGYIKALEKPVQFSQELFAPGTLVFEWPGFWQFFLCILYFIYVYITWFIKWFNKLIHGWLQIIIGIQYIGLHVVLWL